MNSKVKNVLSIFNSRLDTLSHLLNRAEQELGEGEAFLERRLAPDMYPMGSQIAFTCDQPRNFALWCQGKPIENLDHEVASLSGARAYIEETAALLASVHVDDSKLDETKRVGLGPGLYADMSGADYVNEFLMPNFYFHLVTAYDILRMAGLPIGKQDYMRHLLPFVRREE